MNGGKMTDTILNITELISDEYLEKLGMTRDEFRGSRVELLLQAMLDSSIEFIHEESLALMQQYSLTYAEAQSIVINNLLKQKKVIKND